MSMAWAVWVETRRGLMNVLIVVASKHGSTSAIAAAVGEELRKNGLDVSITDADDAEVSVEGFDAAVVGSAVYVGHWMKDARSFLDAHRQQLRDMPLWLFSSGPLSERADQSDDLADVRAVAADLRARDHRVLAGSLDKADLSLAERAAVRMVRAPYGDARDWEEIRAWAKTIAGDLAAVPMMTAAIGGAPVAPPPQSRVVASFSNVCVSTVLQSPFHRLLSGSTDLIRYRGRKSGREITTPTQYAECGDDIVMLVGQPATKTWWQNFRADRDLDVLIRGRWSPMTARAVVGADEPTEIGRLLDVYLARFPHTGRALGEGTSSDRASGAVVVRCRPR